MRTVDVAIAGAGPAGSACALSLRAHAPSLTLALIEATRFEHDRIGETLPPPARPLLEHLGVFDAFLAMQPRQTWGTAAAWGAPSLHENDFLFHARGEGWHLDRGAFDAMLARTAAARGALLLEGTAVRDAIREEGRWRLTLANGDAIGARFLVDATGAATLATRACGAELVPLDRLVGFGRFFDDAPHGDPRTIVEAFDGGWWYTAPLPRGRRFAACMTDSDLADLSDAEVWSDAIAKMPAIGAIAARAERPGRVVRRAAYSRCLVPAAGEDWLAAGDAASRVDPLSSQGVTKALQSGIFASYAIGDRLVRGDDRGLRRYRRFLAAEWNAYLHSRAAFYGREQRWPQSEFWKRRL